jgi:hypothetical protein
MANYSANIAKHATLVAATVDMVTLAQDAQQVEVINRGTVDIYFRVDGTAPAVGGDDCEVLPAGASLIVPTPNSTTVVELISSGTPPYSVVVR